MPLPDQSTVLIVDDNQDMLQLMHTYLQKAGFRVATVDSGHEALAYAQQHRPNIILLDILMPDMGGFETCEQLKINPLTSDIPVIFLSALSDMPSRVAGLQKGAVDYITKPANNDEVIARLKTHLAMQQLQLDLKEQNQRLQEENLKRRRVQDALRESRERYRLLAEHSTDMISRQTPGGIYRYVSPACTTLLGYSIEEMIGHSEIDFVIDEDRDRVLAAIGNLNNRPAQTQYTYRARRKNNTVIWVETTSKLIHHQETGLPLEIIAVSRDITDRKNAEDALQRAHDELEQRVQERTAELVRLNLAYGRFVPHEFLTFLGKESIVDLELGDQVQRNMTLLVTDLRSFTTLSEKMSPQENFNFLNRYLGRVVPLIRQHNGFIDKYIGDAVMALFPDEAEDALRAAINVQREINIFNKQLQASNLPAIGMGASIHTGTLMLGTIGEEERMETTVISDSVNLTFRLEGLTKLYGASIVISQDGLYSIKQINQYHFRFLDRVLVKGKEKPVSVFEIFEGDAPDIAALKIKTLTDFEKGLLHYHSQEFNRAQARFNKVLALNPQDKAAQLYCKRAEQHARYGVPPDWEGVTALTEK